MVKRRTYLDKRIAGECIDIDEEIGAWHDAEGCKCQLSEWLGFTDKEYALFVTKHLTLEEIIKAYKNEST